MTTTLILMRHGDAEDASPDHARPLSAKGRQQCLRTASALEHALAQVGVELERVLCSSATRAHESARLVADALDFRGPLEVSPELYLAEPNTYLDAIRAVGPAARCVLLVAHNPGLSNLASRLDGKHVALGTADYALLQVEGDRPRLGDG